MQELQQPWRRAIGKTEHDAVIDLARRAVAADPLEYVESPLRNLVDRVQVARFHVRQDAPPAHGEPRKMTLDMTLCAEGEVHVGLAPTQSPGQVREEFPQRLRPAREIRRPMLGEPKKKMK